MSTQSTTHKTRALKRLRIVPGVLCPPPLLLLHSLFSDLLNGFFVCLLHLWGKAKIRPESLGRWPQTRTPLSGRTRRIARPQGSRKRRVPTPLRGNMALRPLQLLWCDALDPPMKGSRLASATSPISGGVGIPSPLEAPFRPPHQLSLVPFPSARR